MLLLLLKHFDLNSGERWLAAKFFFIVDLWRESWLYNVPMNGDIMDDLSAVPPGFYLKGQNG
jgi:hypothetical protein